MDVGAFRPLADADYRLLAQLRYTLRQFYASSEQRAREHGITPAQHQLLLVIRGWDGYSPPSVSEIAERLQLKVHSTGELVDRAEENGLVEKHWDPTDARRALVVLSDSGVEKLGELDAVHRRELTQLPVKLQDVLNGDDGGPTATPDS